MALGGRPKEEGGHKPLKISVDEFVAKALKKVGNKSRFIESVARPVLEKMDPGEASIFLWQIDIYLSHGIFEATKKGNFKQVQALGWLADQLELARKLCGIPESNEHLQYLREKRLSPGLTQEDLNLLVFSALAMTPEAQHETYERIMKKAYPKEE